MRTKLKAALVLVSLTLLAGCFQIEVYHKLERFGNSDRGGYRISMSDAMYLLVAAEEGFEEFIADARTFSNPTIRSAGGSTYIEDVSGTASMENIYDDFECWDDPNSSRHSICEFSATYAELDFAGWGVNWTVELEPDMQMLSSNHHRTRTENGRRQYIWHFDGNRVSAYDVTYRVRTPRA